MTLSVISAGFGRTGTMSLKLALEQLGHGPCHHMIEVIENGAAQVPLWNDALADNPDFNAIYAGYNSAVDWPTAAFWQELATAVPPRAGTRAYRRQSSRQSGRPKNGRRQRSNGSRW